MIKTVISFFSGISLLISNVFKICKGYPITYAMMVQVLQDACPLDEFFQQFAEMQNVMKIFAIVTDPSYHDDKGTEN